MEILGPMSPWDQGLFEVRGAAGAGEPDRGSRSRVSGDGAGKRNLGRVQWFQAGLLDL